MKSSNSEKERENLNSSYAEGTCIDESWTECESLDASTWPEYHQMSLSVSRLENGEQTDIRIRRESGKPTDIYVSRGSEAWDVGPDRLSHLPHDLRDEVKWLLNPEAAQKRHWWNSFFLPHHSSQSESHSSSCSDKKEGSCHK